MPCTCMRIQPCRKPSNTWTNYSTCCDSTQVCISLHPPPLTLFSLARARSSVAPPHTLSCVFVCDALMLENWMQKKVACRRCRHAPWPRAVMAVCLSVCMHVRRCMCVACVHMRRGYLRVLGVLVCALHREREREHSLPRSRTGNTSAFCCHCVLLSVRFA